MTRIMKLPKKRFLILFGYQLSNMGWIGAWIAADRLGVFSIPFFGFVFLICFADMLILWKES
jgi:hypothetical protein